MRSKIILFSIVLVFVLVLVIVLMSSAHDASDHELLPLNTPEIIGRKGMWSVHDIVRPHVTCWDKESFNGIKFTIEEQNVEMYARLMFHPDVKCLDRLYTPGPLIPISLRQMLDVIDFPERGYQVQFWYGKHGPNADRDTWVWTTVPYGVLQYHREKVPEGAILWPEDYDGWRSTDVDLKHM